jgi:hypothetical protein
MQFMNLGGANYRPNYIQRIAGIPVSIYLRTICLVSIFLLSLFVSNLYAQAPTSTAVSSGNNPACDNENITFTATVATVPPGADPTGNVEFFDGGTSLGVVALNNGQATLTTSSLNPGNHSITAHYLGGSDDPSNSPTLTQVVNSLPTPNIIINSGSIPLCYNGSSSVTLRSDEGGTGYSYQWYVTGFPPGPGAAISGATSRNYTTNASGFYNVRVTDPNGCVAYSPDFEVTQLSGFPALTGTHNTTQETECAGFDPGQLTVTASGGSGGYSYQWQTASSSGGPWTDVGTNSTSYNPPQLNSAGEYYYHVIITDDCGGTFESVPKHITISAPPATPNPSNNGSLCAGQTLNLSANVNADSYQWNGPNGYSSTNQNPTRTNVTTAMDGNYTLTIIQNGCTSAAGTTNVQINAAPATPNPSNNGPLCAGQTLNLSANVSADSYQWDGPNGYSSTSQNPTRNNVTTAMDGNYTLTITNNGLYQCRRNHECSDQCRTSYSESV